MRVSGLVGGTLLGLGMSLAIASPALAQMSRLDIVAVSSAGSGIDQTARVVQSALDQENLARGITVDNRPGGAGTVGLSYFITTIGDRGDAILVAGMANMMGSYTNASPVTFSDVRPLARLIGEYEVLVVPASSDIESLSDLLKRLRENPGAVSWGGGSPGSADHLLAAQIAEAAGVDPTLVNYIGHSGGGEAAASIMGGHVTVGVSGLGEFGTFLDSGDMRALAISSAEPVEGLDIPTFIEQGIDVQLVNWRGLFAAQGIAEADLAELSEMIDQMVKSETWSNMLAERGWIDLYMPASEFSTFFEEDAAQARATLQALGLAQ